MPPARTVDNENLDLRSVIQFTDSITSLLHETKCVGSMFLCLK